MSFDVKHLLAICPSFPRVTFTKLLSAVWTWIKGTKSFPASITCLCSEFLALPPHKATSGYRSSRVGCRQLGSLLSHVAGKVCVPTRGHSLMPTMSTNQASMDKQQFPPTKSKLKEIVGAYPSLRSAITHPGVGAQWAQGRSLVKVSFSYILSHVYVNNPWPT